MTATTTSRNADVGTLTVDLGQRAYDIVVGEGLLAGAGAYAKAVMDSARAIIVTDATVACLHLDTLTGSLKGAGIETDTIILPAGEATKDFGHLENLTAALLERKVERTTTLIALGGGVIGDLTGFAAAITLRGLPFIQIPTTLLAQVDSSVGGKTGINTPHGKNLVGAFHQPRLVIADTGTLDTLPQRERLAGYAEVVKYGLINDPGFFAWLDENGRAVITGEAAARRHAVMTSCTAKAQIVATDERETGTRALLNLGHTFGHALEAEAGYGDALLHGEAVALGIVMAFDLSVRLGLCPEDDRAKVLTHFEAVGLPVSLKGVADADWTEDCLIAHMTRDKKVEGGKITFILAHGIGKVFVTRDVDVDAVRATLTSILSAA